MQSRVSIDEVGLLIANAWALRGTCARRRVGCLLVDARGDTLSTGYNGPPSGAPHCIDAPCPGAALPSGMGLSICEAVHAESNALIRCRDYRAIHTCYVTSSPCADCVKLLAGTGCRRVVFAERYAHDADAERYWRATPGREWVHVAAVRGK